MTMKNRGRRVYLILPRFKTHFLVELVEADEHVSKRGDALLAQRE